MNITFIKTLVPTANCIGSIGCQVTVISAKQESRLNFTQVLRHLLHIFDKEIAKHYLSLVCVKTEMGDGSVTLLNIIFKLFFDIKVCHITISIFIPNHSLSRRYLQLEDKNSKYAIYHGRRVIRSDD